MNQRGIRREMTIGGWALLIVMVIGVWLGWWEPGGWVALLGLTGGIMAAAAALADGLGL